MTNKYDGVKSSYLYSSNSFTVTYGTYRLIGKEELLEFLNNPLNNGLYPSLFVLVKDSTETRADIGEDAWVLYIPKNFLSSNKPNTNNEDIDYNKFAEYVKNIAPTIEDVNKLLKIVIKKDPSLVALNENAINHNLENVVSIDYSLYLEDTVKKTNKNLVDVIQTIGNEVIDDVKINTLTEQLIIGDYTLVKKTGINLKEISNPEQDAVGEDFENIQFETPTSGNSIVNTFSIAFIKGNEVIYSTVSNYVFKMVDNVVKSSEKRITIFGKYKLVGDQSTQVNNGGDIENTAITDFNLYEIKSTGDELIGKIDFSAITDLRDFKNAKITTVDNQTKTLGELVDFTTIDQIVSTYEELSVSLNRATNLISKIIRNYIYKDGVYNEENKDTVVPKH